jgi:hypothetical protein
VLLSALEGWAGLGWKRKKCEVRKSKRVESGEWAWTEHDLLGV